MPKEIGSLELDWYIRVDGENVAISQNVAIGVWQYHKDNIHLEAFNGL